MPQKAQRGKRFGVECYTGSAMRVDTEEYFLNPPPSSAAERAAKLGVDLRAILENLRLTPEERVRKLEERILAARLKEEHPENPDKS